MMGHRQGQIRILLDQQNGNTPCFVDGYNLFENRSHEDRGDTQRWLVQHQASRFAHDGARNGEHLLLPSGHGSGGLMPALPQARKHLIPEFHVGRYPRLVLPQISPHAQILFHGQVGKHHTPFWHMAEAAGHNGMGWQVRDVLAIITNLSPARFDQPRNRPQGGRLAGPIGANQGHNRPLVHP